MYLGKRIVMVMFVSLLLISVTAVVNAVDDATPAQAVWVDPKVTECLTVGETFVVDVLVNVTAPTSLGGTGMMGWEYKLFWDPSVINVTSYTLNVPPGMVGFLVTDDWSVLGRHHHAYTNLMGTTFTGVASLCTYTFEVLDDGSSDLDLQEAKIVDDKTVTFITDTTDPDTGTIDDGSFCQVAVQYNLSISVVGSGTTNPLPGSYLYAENTVVPVDAQPASGWILDHWELDTVDVGYDDPYEVTMDGNHTLVAVFVEIVQYQLTVDVVGNGTTNPVPGIYMYDQYTSVSVDAIPDFGWMLDHWELNNVDVGEIDPYSVNMDDNYTLVAVFVEKPPSVLIADLNSDGIVDIFDGIIIGVAFGCGPNGQNWNPIADLVEDDLIDIQDIVVWAQQFGQTS
jgi:hypothetical protein